MYEVVFSLLYVFQTKEWKKFVNLLRILIINLQCRESTVSKQGHVSAAEPLVLDPVQIYVSVLYWMR